MALTRREVIAQFRLTPRDAGRLADAFYRAKAAEYRSTLLSLSGKFGHERQAVVLSAEIREALRKEARAHARSVVRTTNRMLANEARRRGDLPPYLLGTHLRTWLADRGRSRAGLIAKNEIATARLDAQVSFYRENGIEPRFEFVGPRAKCRLCRRLKDGGPWPIDVVIAIGLPHIACTHSWRARAYSAPKLRAGGLRPGTISAGRGKIAGIVGGEALVNRKGSTEEALRYLDEIEGV